MKKFITLLTLLIHTIAIYAQESSPEMITDRPDQTESAAVVPSKSVQFETGFVLENDRTNTMELTSYTLNTTLVRIGILKTLELRLGLEYMRQIEKNLVNDVTSIDQGFSPLSAGFKIKIAEEQGWMPAMAFLAGITLPATGDKHYRPTYSVPSMRLAFAHTLTERLSLGYNLGAEWNSDEPIPSWFYSAALGFALFPKIGVFIESYGFLPEEGKLSEHLVDAGITYLLTPNFQLDLSAGAGVNPGAYDSFFGAGFSLRLPN